MGRWNIPSQPRDAQLLMLVRTRVPLDRLIPTERDGAADITAAGTAEDDRWEDFRTTLENARGCDYAGCGRVAEDLEKVLFVISNYVSISVLVSSLPQFHFSNPVSAFANSLA